MSLSLVVNFAGGIGLFLLGMKLMSDGLKLAAGEALREILSHWTSRPLRGVASGVLITAMVQSSSAVIFATIGFVNAGLLTLAQSLSVIYGSNVGTTITSWLVALVGFKVNLMALAMPAVAVGMALQITGASTRRGALGEALTGFGIFFLGIDVLKSTFSGLASTVDLAALDVQGPLGLLLFTGIGFLLTVAMQSSSAALAVTLTAAGGGFIPLTAAAAVVIGANVGTTSTAAFAVLGATSNAKRAASAHVLFNLITGVVAFLALPLLLKLVLGLGELFTVAFAPATALALFHTLTKLMGLALVWPMTGLLVRFLEGRFRTAEEDESRPRYLDRNIAATPDLALQALELENKRAAAIARRMAAGVLSAEGSMVNRLEEDRRVLESLSLATAEFIRRAQSGDLPPDLAAAFPQSLRVTQYLTDIAERSVDIAALHRTLVPLQDPDLAQGLAEFKAACADLLEDSDPDAEEFSLARCEEALSRLQEPYQALKARLLRAGADGSLPIRQMVARLDEISAIRRILDQSVKAARYLVSLKDLPQGNGGEPAH